MSEDLKIIRNNFSFSKYASILLYLLIFIVLLNISSFNFFSKISLGVPNAYAQVDSDGDGIPDDEEIANGTDLNDADLDENCIAASRNIINGGVLW
ncbi:MAG: thrombospondin type 3 repeat-containing protein [Thermodesulfobacteriota bacterium]